MTERYQSWGRYPSAKHVVRVMRWRTDRLPIEETSDELALAFGNGRSYGDSCLNDGGLLIDVRPLDRIISFDRDRGVLRCEAGVTLGEILALCIPSGWFLPVTPGTQFVTVGGAIANDVHGKNHHHVGAFGNHVRCFEVARSDESTQYCSPEKGQDLFSATIGGLGLTGIILWAEIQLKKIDNAAVDVETIPMRDLDHFVALSGESDKTHEYTVAWVDCLAPAGEIGRGVFMRANHSQGTHKDLQENRYYSSSHGLLRIPFSPPFSPLNRLTLKIFNTAYYRSRRKTLRTEGATFFYPLDRIRNWNLLYGQSGFLQYQCVVPDRESIRMMLERIARNRVGSFLAVLKVFGNVRSRGLMSFARPGFTLAMDFPLQNRAIFSLLDELDAIVRDAKGAVYPAKDARMNGENFRNFFPQWKHFSSFVDRRFSSSFWRRVMAEEQQ